MPLSIPQRMHPPLSIMLQPVPLPLPLTGRAPRPEHRQHQPVRITLHCLNALTYHPCRHCHAHSLAPPSRTCYSGFAQHASRVYGAGRAPRRALQTMCAARTFAYSCSPPSASGCT